jgi:hypothetical protein
MAMPKPGPVAEKFGPPDGGSPLGPPIGPMPGGPGMKPPGPNQSLRIGMSSPRLRLPLTSNESAAL